MNQTIFRNEHRISEIKLSLEDYILKPQWGLSTDCLLVVREKVVAIMAIYQRNGATSVLHIDQGLANFFWKDQILNFFFFFCGAYSSLSYCSTLPLQHKSCYTQHIVDGCGHVPVELKKHVKGLNWSFWVIACQPLRIDHNEFRAKASWQEASAVI